MCSPCSSIALPGRVSGRLASNKSANEASRFPGSVTLLAERCLESGAETPAYRGRQRQPRNCCASLSLATDPPYVPPQLLNILRPILYSQSVQANTSLYRRNHSQPPPAVDLSGQLPGPTGLVNEHLGIAGLIAHKKTARPLMSLAA